MIPSPDRAHRAVTWGLVSFLVVVVAAIVGAVVGPAFPAPLLPRPTPSVSTPPWLAPPSSDAPLAGATPLTGTAPEPVPASVGKQLDSLLVSDGGSFSGEVADGLTGQTLYSRAGNEPVAPASNLKLLTAAAVLTTLGPDAVLQTRVERGSTPGSVVLVAGGDVFLGAGESQPGQVVGHAGLATLARETAAALGPVHGQLSVQLDTSLFTGAPINPAWDPEDVEAGQIAPIAPIALNIARTQPGDSGPRPADPAMAAGTAFRDALAAALGPGADVADGVSLAPAAKGAQQLASVASSPVADQLAYTLQESDNYAAETLARLAAAASGREASIAGARAVLEATAQHILGTTAGLQLDDASGLAISDRISPADLVTLMRAMTTGDDARLRSALDGLPIAGLSGTLAKRYPPSSPGAGFVRAKTGTLNTVIGLTGYVVDSDGRLLVFSFVGNGLTPGSPANAAAVDAAASALAGCGCR
ncbi:D-alanyl-D-alanine carboxypeptidase/D-alanyl-D-alanine endopeptidase [Sinomonas terrae]|uniref:D-alanyl-D-alanine carboxypeptidase/D-alanyl-D-alanine-endopeptidase n=1 Tax=Sinomonas terrae TaxID=2908838 RepID=A0ABS9U693_9MICC|nr:D-alanyl-D-alanine carboxypeptidase/D-alanyl-D-alanine-endopeptidase [Sinomonas terrae]MCH6472218.1 D-alanyl-D-alanine carboxypeptidase/D-alanyl-D-alanine-endopeptidase [Sinomonas terrae]